MPWNFFASPKPEPLTISNAQVALPPPDQPHGLLYGYSVYTTLKLPLSEQKIDLHLQRLKKDCKAMGLMWHYVDHEILSRIQAQFDPAKPVVRITVVADVEHYGAFFAEGKIPSKILLDARPTPANQPDGLKLKTVPYVRPQATIKHGSMAELIFLKRQARQEGFDDILLINSAGHICESSTANLFMLENNALRTPEPERDGCLPGITRSLVLQGAQLQQISVSTAPISMAALQEAEGAFITNAVSGVSPVASIDGKPLPWPSQARRLCESLGHMVNT